MQPRPVLRALALAFLVAAPVLAQSTRRVVVTGAPSAAPASGGAAAPAPASGGLPTAQPGPTTVAPGPGVNREELTPEQKAAMKEVDRMRAEKARIDAELALAEAKRTEELAPLNAEASKLNAERALRLAKANAEAAALEDERAKLERQAALESARAAARLAERNNKIRELEAEAKQLQLESANTVARLTNEIARHQKEDEARKVASKAKPKYLKDPLVAGTLVISDRRIPFNGAGP